MADTGWVIAGTGANDASYGTVAWGSPTRITADDGNFAGALALDSINTPTQYLKGTNFGFAIPLGATIDGIQVRWAMRTGAGQTDVVHSFDRIRLVDAAGVIGSTDRAIGTYTGPEANYDFGGAADLWGASWAESDIEDADFGGVLAAAFFSGVTRDARCDAMWMKIYYTEVPFLPPPWMLPPGLRDPVGMVGY